MITKEVEITDEEVIELIARSDVLIRLGVLKRLAVSHPDLPVVILTVFAAIDTAIEAVQAGAADYLSKPFRMEEIKLVVRRTLAARRHSPAPAAAAPDTPEPDRDRGALVGQSHQMAEIYTRIARVATLDTTVLIQGETGTGKELIARAVHHRSGRRDRPLVKVNCSAISAGLVESELFGHVKGAFTGALERRVGRFELAHHGTIFLDEIGDLPLETQIAHPIDSPEPAVADLLQQPVTANSVPGFPGQRSRGGGLLTLDLGL